MKLDTAIVMSKGGAYLLGGLFAPWAAALSRWVIDGIWPPGIVWCGAILPLSVWGATNAWLAFCSGSWKEYAQQQRANATGEVQVQAVAPTVASAEERQGHTEQLRRIEVERQNKP